MGGCCGSSRNSHLVGTPVYYYCPESFEELAAPSSPRTRPSVGSAFTNTGLLFDIPDTFRAPAPLPYDSIIKGKISRNGSSFEEECKARVSSVILSPRKSDVSAKQKGYEQFVDEEEEEEEEEEEDSCPICFEDYDVENPRLTTKCDHDFHLSCLLEWIERSDTCPICDKEVVFDDCLN